jgi:iron complex transport system substrate-binding protein
VVFELGLGGRLVGATTFCKYPPEASKIRRIGGFLDVNLERVVTSKADIVIALTEHAETVSTLDKLGVHTLVIDHRTVAGIKESLRVVGKACGRVDAASEVLHKLESREEKLKTASAGLPAYRVLVSVGRTREGSSVTGVYVSGTDGFYSDLLALIGMQNVNKGGTVSIPSVSVEGLLALAPDAVVEIAETEHKPRKDELLAFWKGLRGFPPTASGRIVVVTEDFASIPGPRYIELAELFFRKLRMQDQH